MTRSPQTRFGRFARRYALPHTLRGLVTAAVIGVALAVVATDFVFNLFASGVLARRAASVQYDIGLALVSAAAATVVGVFVGVRLTRTVSNPVDQLVEHVQTEGYLAAEGAPYSGENFADDPDLPRELRELGAVVEDLLRHLATRQAELKTAVREARLAEETLSIVVNDSLEGKIMISDGKVVLVNPAATMALSRVGISLLGRPIPEDLGGLPIKDEHGRLLTADDLYRQALEGPVHIHLDTIDPPSRWYVVQAQRHADDFHNRILITLQDITEERRLQQVRSEIVSIVSHDLRTPLAVVVGYLDLLHRPLPEEDRLKALEAAKRNAGRMADILEDLLSATKAEELLAPTSLAPVPLAALAQDVVSSMAPTHADRTFTLAADCLPVVMGDEGRLRQALVNLVTNAFKYSPDGAPVTVRVTCRGSRAQLAVEDAGSGVAKGDRARIFERFARLDRDHESQSSAGLGLYIVRIVSENHGGHVRVEESPLGGARFVIELPWEGDVDHTTRGSDLPKEENRTAAGVRMNDEI